MNNLRNYKPKLFTKNNKELKLQIVDWNSYNESPEVEEGQDKYKDNSKYIIQIFGVDEDNQSISLKVNGFKPRFFVNIPKNWEKTQIDIFLDHLKSNVKKRYKDSIHDCKVLFRHKFRGFTNYEHFKFLKLTFHNTYAMNQYVNILKKKILILPLGKGKRKYDLYESNIEAFIRFIHIQNINPAGWIQVAKKKYQIVEPTRTYCQKEIEVHWKEVKHYERNDIAPLLVASFDIECDSSHGDFPLAKKGYKKFANEIIDNIQKKYKLFETKKLHKELFSEFEKKKEFVWKLLESGFSKEPNSEEISFLYTKEGKKLKKKELEEVIDRITNTAFFKIKKISDNKELKGAVEETKRIWGNQSLEVLDSIAFDMGKRHEVSKEKILFRIVSRDVLVDKLTGIFDNFLPPIEGDKIIQIGTTIHRYGEEECFMKHIVTLDTCNPIPGAEVVACKREEDVIKEWFNFIRILDPDIITGYNIFGFDFSFIYYRAEELGIVGQLGTLGRMKGKDLVLEEKNLSSSALGENILTFLNMEGRVCMDLLKVVQKDHKLVSYKLDTVAETFISGGIKEIIGPELKIGGAKDLNVGNYVVLFTKKDKYRDGKKFKILSIKDDIITLDEEIEDIIDTKPSWRLAKDDVGPKDIFRLQKGSAEDRKIVATYCIQDCSLCNKLINKLSIVSNNIGMANVCFVPLSYIFLRGQGVKIFSLVAKFCKDKSFLIPVLKKPKTEEEKEELKEKKRKFGMDFGGDDSDEEEDEGGYEGAIVLKPNPGIYLDKYVTVLDYSSLYPSSMISENLSHDTYIMEDKYDNLEGYEYKDITHDVYEWIDPKIKSKGKKKVGQKTCRFVQFPDGRKGIIPEILQKLLKERKSTRKKILYITVKYNEDGEEKEFSGLYEEKGDLIVVKTVEGDIIDFPKENLIDKKDTYSEFQKEVLDGLQLAYKITANSLYGQIGATTSQIYLKDIAASTTATGRNLLHLAQEKTLEKFDGAEIVYGDTDSIFINFNGKDDDGNILTGKEGLKKSIDLGVQAEEYIQQFLLPPHRLEYEKTFWPFILFTKKRYIGNKYEFDLDKFKQTSMGIVLKRRDNANIVKHIYGGIIKIIMEEHDIPKSINFLKGELDKLVDGQFPLDMLTITKSLKSYYKNPESIAHKVLADRIGEREPGNKPLPSDRIPYVYITKKEKKGVKMLQGDKIELPTYIQEHNLKPDYLTYITNQIQKPVCQIYALIVEQLEGYKYHQTYFKDMFKRLEREHGEQKALEKTTQKKNDLVGDILFSDSVRTATNKKNNVKEITSWFTKC
jgi:DNA polymerase elongation subunit (family B)